MHNELTAAKNAEISRRILEHVAAGKSTAEAIDAVIGAGTFDRLVGDLYDALRAKGGAK